MTSPDYTSVTSPVIYTFSILAGVEKNNDDGKQHYFSSNRHDAAAEIVRADERLEILRADWQREKRPYRKRQTEEQSHQAKRHHTEPSSIHF